MAKPGCLELVEYIYNRKIGWFSASVVTKHLQMAREDVEKLLKALAELELVSSMELELEEGDTKVYEVSEPWKLIPFLMLARTLMQSESNYLRLYAPLPLFGPGEKWEDGKKEISK